MKIASPLLLTLTRDQATRLQAYLQQYRCAIFATRLPCPDRNNTLRIVQTMQGKLIKTMDQGTALFRLFLAPEEMSTLKTLTAELLLLYARKPPGEQRDATLTYLAALKISLNHF